MRKFILFSLLLFSLTCSSQEKYSYSEVISVDSTSSDIIYSKLKTWCNLYYKNYTDKFQYDDVDKKQINGTSSFSVEMSILLIPIIYNINYNVNIQIKDNRFKILLENFNFLSEKESSKYASEGQLSYVYKTLPEDLSTLTTAKLTPSRIKSIRKYNDKSLILCDKNVSAIMKNLKDYLKKPNDDNW